MSVLNDLYKTITDSNPQKPQKSPDISHNLSVGLLFSILQFITLILASIALIIVSTVYRSNQSGSYSTSLVLSQAFFVCDVILSTFTILFRVNDAERGNVTNMQQVLRKYNILSTFASLYFFLGFIFLMLEIFESIRFGWVSVVIICAFVQTMLLVISKTL